MKKLLLISFFSLSVYTQAQVQTPKASPLAKVEQRVGLTDISISYSRPAVNHRIIFGDLIPYGTRWRLGANENTKFRTNDDLTFSSGVLKAGTYSLFATPNIDHWVLEFYSDTTNWGLPEKWDESKVVLILKTGLEKPRMTTENLTISIENMEFNGADLVVAWDEHLVRFPFTVNTKVKVLESIDKTMKSKSASANDYHAAASYYFSENLDLKQALEWSKKAVELKGPSAYWMTRLKAQLQAANGDIKGAMETAKLSLQEAKKDGDENYVRMNQQSIDEWSKKK